MYSSSNDLCAICGESSNVLPSKALLERQRRLSEAALADQSIKVVGPNTLNQAARNQNPSRPRPAPIKTSAPAPPPESDPDTQDPNYSPYEEASLIRFSLLELPDPPDKK